MVQQIQPWWHVIKLWTSFRIKLTLSKAFVFPKSFVFTWALICFPPTCWVFLWTSLSLNPIWKSLTDIFHVGCQKKKKVSPRFVFLCTSTVDALFEGCTEDRFVCCGASTKKKETTQACSALLAVMFLWCLSGKCLLAWCWAWQCCAELWWGDWQVAVEFVTRAHLCGVITCSGLGEIWCLL